MGEGGEVIETTDMILLMAFRYALPRNTGAPMQVVNELMKHWDKLPEWMREQIMDDIMKQKALADRTSYDDCYYHDYSEDWDVILARINEEEE